MSAIVAQPVHTSGPAAEFQPELVDVNAVAKLLSCSSRTVLRLAADGAMPKPMKLGNLARWSRSGVIEWIAAGCPRSGEKNKASENQNGYTGARADGAAERA